MSRRRKRHKHEDHVSHEAWAIPYGDLITLLLAFFVVMYAISSVNEGKYRVLSDSMVAAFRGTPMTLQPVQAGEKQVGSGADLEISIVQQAMIKGQPRSLLQTHAPTPASGPAATAFRRMAENVEMALSHLVDANLITVRRTNNWVEVEVRSDILFPSGSAVVSPAALPVLEQIAAAVKGLPNLLRVEGHTDNVPVRSGPYRSNWELSAGRAASVVHLFTENGVDPSRLSVVAYGEQRPLKVNATPEGRNANRRVLIVILGGDSPRIAPPEDEAPVTGTEPAAVSSTPPLPVGNPTQAAL
jgi:chemotaxis protein MotB